MKHRPVIIDSNSLIMRCIQATVRADLRADGVPTGGVHAAVRTLVSSLRSLGPFRTFPVFAAVDAGVPQFRRDLIPEYKVKREEQRAQRDHREVESVKMQLAMWAELLPMLGLVVLRFDGWEADDVVARLALLMAPSNPIVMSGDKDLLQCVSVGASVYNFRKTIDASNFEETTNVPMDRYILYRALSGDTSDGISGVPGCGETRAAACVLRASGATPYLQLRSIVAAILRQQMSTRKVWERAIVANRRKIEDIITAINMIPTHPNHPYTALDALIPAEYNAKPDRAAFNDFCRRYKLRMLLADAPEIFNLLSPPFSACA